MSFQNRVSAHDLLMNQPHLHVVKEERVCGYAGMRFRSHDDCNVF